MQLLKESIQPSQRRATGRGVLPRPSCRSGCWVSLKEHSRLAGGGFRPYWRNRLTRILVAEGMHIRAGFVIIDQVLIVAAACSRDNAQVG